MPPTIVFLHGWSVHSTETYGELPERLAKEIPDVKTHHLRLAKYISFRDEVRMNDLANAMEAAVRAELSPGGEKFAVITHSTGGPVVRSWWQRHYVAAKRPCPMTHAIHLAGAHFGSALAQLGKGPLGRMKSFIEAIEPGIGVLDWLELGSPEGWLLNEEWIRMPDTAGWPNPVFQFCLTGQQIDRKLYDHLNSYTGETGSDGVVRAAAANLNASYIRLIQKPPSAAQLDRGAASQLVFDAQGIVRSQETPFALIPGASHTGERKGIMKSVSLRGATPPVVARIKEALAVTDATGFAACARKFAEETQAVLEAERVEFEDNLLIDRVFIHDACSMVIVRIRDEEGYVPEEFRIIFTGEDNDPNRLPQSFLVDRQRNRRDKGAITFFFDYDVMHGCRALPHPKKPSKKVREKLPPLSGLGLRIEAFPADGFAHYYPCEAKASSDLLHQILRPHQTTLIDVVLKRIVHKGAFLLAPDLKREEFRDTEPGGMIE